jgi:hypothetical protein
MLALSGIMVTRYAALRRTMVLHYAAYRGNFLLKCFVLIPRYAA